MTLPGEPVETSSRLGEVVEASSAEFTVHCYLLYEAAPLGALVRTMGDQTVYGVVRNVATLPLDPARRPVARGQDEPDQEAVYRSNPQLPKLLRTDFQAAIVGYLDDGGLHHYLPSRPPKILAFVQACDAKEVRTFTERLDFLPLLLTGAAPLTDEVVAAFFRQVATVHNDPDAFLIAAGRQVARLISRDLQRVNTLLSRLRS